MRIRGYCRSHKRARPCAICLDYSVRMQAEWADPARRALRLRAVRTSSTAWGPAERIIVQDMAGHAQAADIARELTARGFARNKAAVYDFAEKHRIDLFRTGKTVNDLGALFGFASKSSNTSVQWWVKQGLLHGRPYGRFVVYDPDEIERFIRAEPWAYDVERMPASRFRQLADVVRRRDPWLKLSDAARLAGCHRDSITKRIRLGEIDARRRAGHHGQIIIRASTLPALKESVADGIARRRAGLTLVPGARQRYLRDPGINCPGCGAAVRAPRRTWCSDRCSSRVWAANHRMREAKAAA